MCTAFPLITPASPAVSAQAVKLPAGLLQLEVASESDLLSSDMSLEECLFLGPGLFAGLLTLPTAGPSPLHAECSK